MDYVLKMSFNLENINLIGKWYKGLLFYSSSTTQHKFLFFKIPIFVKSRIRDVSASSTKLSALEST